MAEEIILIEKRGKRRMVKRFVLEDFKCKYCGGSNLVLYAKYSNESTILHKNPSKIP